MKGSREGLKQTCKAPVMLGVHPQFKCTPWQPSFNDSNRRVAQLSQRLSLMSAAQVLDYIKVDDFQGTESLQGNETRARVVEALKITSHTLQATRSEEGTIVTVKDLINLPREVSI